MMLCLYCDLAITINCNVEVMNVPEYIDLKHMLKNVSRRRFPNLIRSIKYYVNQAHSFAYRNFGNVLTHQCRSGSAMNVDFQ